LAGDAFEEFEEDARRIHSFSLDFPSHRNREETERKFDLPLHSVIVK
jgi:hypothetical protein